MRQMEMEEKYTKAVNELNSQRAEIQKIQERINQLIVEQKNTKNLIIHLREEMDNAKRRLLNASKFNELLSDEKVRWE
jgi:low affinity Fe/Cu permease